MYLSQNNFKKDRKNQKYKPKSNLLEELKKNSKFKLTSDQQKAIKDIFTDMQSKYHVNRMLIGDVGCCKSVVALSTITTFAIWMGAK